MRDTAEYAFCSRLGPANTVRNCVQHGQVTGELSHVLAAELHGIYTSGFSHLIHEALDKDCVLINVHTTPETWRHVRITHRMIHQLVRELIAEAMFPTIKHTLEHDRITAFLLCNDCWTHSSQNRLSRQTHMHTGQILVGIKGACELTHHDGVVTTLCHIFFTGPDQFDRYTRHLLGDVDRLRGVVLEGTTTSKAPTEIDLINLALIPWQAGGRNHCCQ